MLLREILERAGIEVRETRQKSEVVLCCPFCPDRGFSEDTKFHFGLNLEKGWAHCFRCDWKSSNFLHTARMLAREFEVPFKLQYREMPEKEEEPKEPETTAIVASGLPPEYEKFTGAADRIEKRARAYLHSRGISLLQISKYKIGYAAAGAYGWRILFPVFGPGNKVYGCVGRAIDARMKPKYLNSPGLKLLWNAHRGGQIAVVVEGIMDALRVEKALLRVRGMTAVARLGSAITPYQLMQLRTFERVIILPDWDEPGVKGAVGLAEQCLESHIPVEMAVPEMIDGRDPGSMEEQEILDCLRSAEKWKKEMTYRMRTIPRREVAV